MAEAYEVVEPRITYLYTLQRDIVRAGRDARWRELRRYVNDDSTADTVDRYWQLKQRVENHRHTVIVAFAPWLISGRAELTSALLSELARALGARLGEDIRRAFGKILKRLTEFAPIAGAGLDIAAHGIGAGTLFRAGGDWSQKIADRMISGPSLDELKKELAQLLSRLNGQQILVVLDDLDRLTPFEALEMVSVVKNLADLPNVIYLLSYDDVRLDQIVGEVTKTDGHAFLEKIVQYPVHIPAIDRNDLSRLLDADLDALLPPLSEGDTYRLQYAWREVLSFYVSTPRDVRRLVNSFAVAAAALSDFTDPVDLIILDTLRLFEPNLYQYIRRNIADLTEETSIRRDDQGAAGIMEDVLKGSRETIPARTALALLFSRAEQLLKISVYSGPRDNDVLRKARRISVADFAPAYFGLDPQKATWGRSELDRILNF
jgi:predicted KAP-like P-loop ATPase